MFVSGYGQFLVAAVRTEDLLFRSQFAVLLIRLTRSKRYAKPSERTPSSSWIRFRHLEPAALLAICKRAFGRIPVLRCAPPGRLAQLVRAHA